MMLQRRSRRRRYMSVTKTCEPEGCTQLVSAMNEGVGGGELRDRFMSSEIT
jgi:hypothetical protein